MNKVLNTPELIALKRRKPPRMEARLGNIRGVPIRRATIFFTTAGCEKKLKSNVCVMCPIETSTFGAGLSGAAFEAQIDNMQEWLFTNGPFEEIDFYNDGSFINEQEIPLQHRDTIVAL